MKAEALYFENWQRSIKTIDITAGQLLANKVNAQKGLCYENSFKAMTDEMEYVEGFAIFAGETFFNLWHHGWLEYDGAIIDPYPGLDWQRYMVIYFPGKKYRRQEIKWTGKVPLHWNLKTFIFAVKVYHAAIEEKFSWLLTAGKLILAYVKSR